MPESYEYQYLTRSHAHVGLGKQHSRTHWWFGPESPGRLALELSLDGDRYEGCYLHSHGDSWSDYKRQRHSLDFKREARCFVIYPGFLHHHFFLVLTSILWPAHFRCTASGFDLTFLGHLTDRWSLHREYLCCLEMWTFLHLYFYNHSRNVSFPVKACL